MSTENISRAKRRPILTALAVLATSLVTVACPPKRVSPPPPGPLWPVMQSCSMSWGEERQAKLSAKYENLRKGGEAEWKAAIEAGGTVMKYFKDDTVKLKVYEDYLRCVKPAIDKYVSGDQRPTVVLLGSKDDYTTYRLSELEATSVELLHGRLGLNFRIVPFTVSYAWNNEESIRAERPAVIVMHASAFHHDQHEDQAVEKFQALVSSLYGLPETKFLVFSRVPPENPPRDLCQRWNRQVNFLSGKRFEDRLVFYPLAREESNFTGKAGIEVSQIVRCLSGLEATEYCSIGLRDRAKEAHLRTENSSCGPTSR